jgi:hypothetical protein
MKAGTKSHRIAVEVPTATMPVYTFGKGWAEEEMGSPRVMGDATLLPNGMVVLLNGAEVGGLGQPRQYTHGAASELKLQLSTIVVCNCTAGSMALRICSRVPLPLAYIIDLSLMYSTFIYTDWRCR